MAEYEDGRLGEPHQLKDVQRAFEESSAPNVSKFHIAEKMEELKKASENIRKSENTQLNRIENMLTSIVLHFNVPFKGITQIHNSPAPEREG